MTDNEKETLYKTVSDLRYAASLLQNIDHNFGYILEASSYYTIIKSCEDILKAVSEEIYQKIKGEGE
jgi:hypothetical protein